MIEKTNTRISKTDGRLTGDNVSHSVKTLGQMTGVFADEELRASMDANTVVYCVECHKAETEGKEGGLFFGTSFVYPGRVGDEYFMTQGHFHSKAECAEYYWCISGKGLLVLMDEEGNTRAEEMSLGSLHYIRGNTAHRLVNTGRNKLIVGACWPSDAGHDYKIAKEGFTCRVLDVDGKPTLVPVKQ